MIPLTDDERRLEARIAERFGPFASLERLAPDASVRAFFRARREGRESIVIVHDADAAPRDLARMVAAAQTLSEIRVPVPRILDRDDTLRALAMEDMGETLLADALPAMSVAERGRAYAFAGAMAARIALNGGDIARQHAILTKPVLSEERARTELAFFAVHDVANRRALTDPGLLGSLSAILDHVAFKVAQPEPAFAHRDLHSRNLTLMPDGSLGLLDFQDALFAPPFYDLVSLLFDPYVPLSERIRDEAAAAYTGVAGQSLAALDNPLMLWVALQRLLKAIGTYAFQARHRRRDHFERYIQTAEQRACWIAERLPSELRAPTLDVFERLGFRRA